MTVHHSRPANHTPVFIARIAAVPTSIDFPLVGFSARALSDAAPAGAAPPPPRAQTVRFGDLDRASQSGVAGLKRHVPYAAREGCNTAWLVADACTASARGAAMNELGGWQQSRRVTLRNQP